MKLNKAEFAPKTHEAAKPTDHKNEIMKKDKDGKIQSQAETTANATANTTVSANSTQPATAAEKTKAWNNEFLKCKTKRQNSWFLSLDLKL